jgi:hypothetical protein
MTDRVTVDLEENSKYRVTLELARQIAAEEAHQGAKRDRRYWLDLYARCRKVVVDGYPADNALQG